ncbi:MAG: hypothetical protein OHK0017_07780 [Patescibacteria group bacterium]
MPFTQAPSGETNIRKLQVDNLVAMLSLLEIDGRYLEVRDVYDGKDVNNFPFGFITDGDANPNKNGDQLDNATYWREKTYNLCIVFQTDKTHEQEIQRHIREVEGVIEWFLTRKKVRDTDADWFPALTPRWEDLILEQISSPIEGANFDLSDNWIIKIFSIKTRISNSMYA